MYDQTHLIAVSLCWGLLQLFGTPLPLKKFNICSAKPPLHSFIAHKPNWCFGQGQHKLSVTYIDDAHKRFLCQNNICYSKMNHKTAVNLWEVHGISGPVVHQFMEVICEGSFPLMGGWHVGGQTLRTPLTLTQTTWTAQRIGAVSPCGRRRGRGGEEQRMWDSAQTRRW